jgi:GNAT superfamily N-acetyltransferase
MTSSVAVREARIEDVPAILKLIKELAAFENLSHTVTADEASLREHGFGAEPRFKVLLAEADGEAVGFLSYMIRYSIWGGSEFINLDDLFVSERVRGRGVGRMLMRRMAEIASARTMVVRWELLPDNAPAKAFYEALGATVFGKLIARWPVEATRSVCAEEA